MEKIYMEESRKQRSSLFDFSVVLSFIVAIFGIFSIALVGVVSTQKNGLISYAAPLTSDTFNFVKGENGTGVITSFTSSGQTGPFNVEKFYADTAKTISVFCVEHMADTQNGPTYNKGAVIDDYGLLYLLNHTSANSGVTVTEYNNSSLETYITQVAIWMYLYEKEKKANGSVSSTSMNYISDTDIANIKNAIRISDIDDSNMDFSLADGTIYDTYIKPLVDSALSATNYVSVSVSAASDNISKTDDENYYQSDVITVNGNPSSAMSSFDVSVEGIDGLIVINENGETISSLKNLAPGTKFRIRVPAEKVTETAQNAKISVTGHFNSLTGNYYTNDGLQKVVTVTGSTIDAKSGTEIEFVGVPDTGMNGIQTIYFIGLVVLLCGVGIVYANAKPVKNNQ